VLGSAWFVGEAHADRRSLVAEARRPVHAYLPVRDLVPTGRDGRAPQHERGPSDPEALTLGETTSLRGQWVSVEQRGIGRFEVADLDAVGADVDEGVDAGDPGVVESDAGGGSATDDVLAAAQPDDAAGTDPALDAKRDRSCGLMCTTFLVRVSRARHRQERRAQQRRPAEDVVVGDPPPLDDELPTRDAHDGRELVSDLAEAGAARCVDDHVTSLFGRASTVEDRQGQAHGASLVSGRPSHRRLTVLLVAMKTCRRARSFGMCTAVDGPGR
jgi:hypothetical protein